MCVWRLADYRWKRNKLDVATLRKERVLFKQRTIVVNGKGIHIILFKENNKVGITH